MLKLNLLIKGIINRQLRIQIQVKRTLMVKIQRVKDGELNSGGDAGSSDLKGRHFTGNTGK